MAGAVRFSIRKKFFFAMMVISMVPIVLFAFFSLNITYKAMLAQLIDSRSTSMDWLNDRLTMSVRSFTDQFYEYEVDRQMKAGIISWAFGEEIGHVGQNHIRRSFETALSVNPSIRSVELYSLKTGDGLVSTRSSFYNVLDAGVLQLFEERGGDRQTNLVFERDGDDVLVIHQTNDFSTGIGAALMVFRIRPHALTGIIEKVEQDAGEDVLLLNDRQAVLAVGAGDSEPEPEALKAHLETLQTAANGFYQADSHFYFFESVSDGKLQTVLIVPNNILVNTLYQTTSIGVIIIVSAIAAAVLLSLILSHIISRPIMLLSKRMLVTSIQDFDQPEPVVRRDEIGFLQESFGIMIRQNQELIAKEYQSKLEMRNAQFRALQAQINPHFMYNTLQVIGGMSLKGQSEKIYPVVTALGDIMRYCFSFSQEMVPFQKELMYLQGYLSIQNHRFNDRISLQMDMQEEMMGVLVPKLILQPILENSFRHGLAHKSGRWHITIRAYAYKESGTFVIKVTDNGLGISADRLKWIGQQLDAGGMGVLTASSHIGLANVHARIFLRDGKGYGLRVESDGRQGTTVTVSIRLITGGNV